MLELKKLSSLDERLENISNLSESELQELINEFKGTLKKTKGPIDLQAYDAERKKQRYDHQVGSLLDRMKRTVRDMLGDTPERRTRQKLAQLQNEDKAYSQGLERVNTLYTERGQQLETIDKQLIASKCLFETCMHQYSRRVGAVAEAEVALEDAEREASSTISTEVFQKRQILKDARQGLRESKRTTDEAKREYRGFMKKHSGIQKEYERLGKHIDRLEDQQDAFRQHLSTYEVQVEMLTRQQGPSMQERYRKLGLLKVEMDDLMETRSFRTDDLLDPTYLCETESVTGDALIDKWDQLSSK